MKKLASQIVLLALFSVLLFLSGGCAIKDAKSLSDDPMTEETETETNIFDRYLKTNFAPADGFDFPVGNADGKGIYIDKQSGKRHDGWYISTQFAEEYSLGIHPGEDWNGAGGGVTDLGQDVFAVANGRVVFAENCGRLWGNVIIIEHVFYENHERRKIRSLYAHLKTLNVRRGGEVKRRQLIATVGQDPDKTFKAHLHLEFRW